MRWTLALVASLAPSASADRVLTSDGRILTPKKARVEAQGYRLEFEHGTIVLTDKSLVASAEIEGDMSDYVPANEDEKAKLAQGYVKYRGRWMSRPGYQEDLRSRRRRAASAPKNSPRIPIGRMLGKSRPPTSVSAPTRAPRSWRTTPSSWRRSTP